MMDPDAVNRRRILALAVLFEGGLGLVAWGLGWLVGQPIEKSLWWDNRDALLGIGACLPMLVLFLASVRWPLGPLARIKQFGDEVVRPMFAPCTVLDLAIISLLAGAGEELLFRGVLQGTLTTWFNPLIGIAGASLLFGLMHPITPAYIVLAGGLGVYLGWLTELNGNLLIVIVAHALYDLLALLYLVRRPRMSSADRSPAVSEPPPRPARHD
jgi:membrane protease YdiL (CAAX protease family)